MYEVFIDGKTVILTDKPEPEVGHDKFIYLKYDDFEELHFVLEMLDNVPGVRNAVFHHPDVDALFRDFRAHFHEIDAAGGVVVNPSDEVLLIHRRGKWDLPKGKREPHETREEAALREVEEECGVTSLKCIGHLIDTYHVYAEKGRHILKKTEWFDMRAPKGNLKPQLEEDIERAEWVSNIDIDALDTYPNIRKVLRARLGG